MCRHEHELCKHDLRGLSKHKVNQHYFEFVRNVTKEECEANDLNYREGYGIYKCRICGSINFYRRQSFKKHLKVCKNGCNGVKGAKINIVIGFNNIAITHPEYIKYFVNIEDAYTHTYASIDKVDLICPNCGHIKQMRISTLTSQGLSCNFCSDGISRPNKIIAMIVEALGLNYELEYTVEGYNQYRFDIYLTDYKQAIENDGSQHYAYLDESLQNKKVWNNKTGMEIHYTDLAKESILMNNDIGLIVIDCSESNIDYIRNSVEKHPFFKQFDLSIIDWQEIDIKAQKSKKIEVCKYWKEQKEIDKDLTPRQIKDIFKLDFSTVVDYLNWGDKNGLCTYSGEKEIENNNKRRSKFVYLIKSDDTKWFDEAMNKTQLIKISGISTGTITRYSISGEPLKYDKRANYNPKYIGSYIVDAYKWDAQHN